jgi:hypothetical protein
MIVLRKMLNLAISDRDKAVSWLLIGAIFFAMRSCEYLKTAAENKKRTKIIRIGNIVFKKDGKILHHKNDQLKYADLVQIKFIFQKNDRRDVCIHMFSSGDKVLCPVIAWANVVKRVLNIPQSSENSEVCLFFDGTHSKLLRADHVRSRLRAIVELIGEENLGFRKEEIGLHSIRSGGAMAMFLSGTSVIIIMRVGRWSSEAFLEYIRDQVETFTLDVSKNMLQVEEFFNLNVHAKSKNTVHDENEKETISEDGPDSVPFSIRFNRLALNGRKDPRNEDGG